MADAHQPGRSACLQRRSCLRRVRGRLRQRDSHRAGLRRRRPAPRGDRRHRKVRGIRKTREGVRPRVQVPTPSTKSSYLNWPTKRLVVDGTRHRSNLILALLSSAQFMLILGIAIVNVALPSMQRTLGLSAENIHWVVVGYALTFGGFLMLGGRLADVVGRRRMFLTGLVLFIGASMLGGFSQSGGMLIAARVIQGFAGALVSPAALSLLTTTFKEGRERNRALGMWSAMAAGSCSWRWGEGQPRHPRGGEPDRRSSRPRVRRDRGDRARLCLHEGADRSGSLCRAAVCIRRAGEEQQPTPSAGSDAEAEIRDGGQLGGGARVGRDDRRRVLQLAVSAGDPRIFTDPGRSCLAAPNGTDHGRLQHRRPDCDEAGGPNPDRIRNSCAGGGDAPVPENLP